MSTHGMRTPDLRRYVANNGRIYTTHTGQAAAAPNRRLTCQGYKFKVEVPDKQSGVFSKLSP